MSKQILHETTVEVLNQSLISNTVSGKVVVSQVLVIFQYGMMALNAGSHLKKCLAGKMCRVLLTMLNGMHHAEGSPISDSESSKLVAVSKLEN